MSIQIEVVDVQDVRVFQITGQINSVTAITLGEHLLDASQRQKHRLVLDLAGVDYLTSAGLREILGAARRAQDGGGDLCLCALMEPVAELLRMTGLLKHLSVFDTRDEAVQRFVQP